ncbi:alpha/beta hydrolase family esterase [Clostridium ganghwense]|uniref:Phospholipase n=1 Tax=Clostridium ganghwense TaxID=312089 RepID=A0ABT4CQG3_9CLOT|nr:hypothetical protein [Clostridium ganghwense]MCY6370693.1 hypothetical protein [Clostridium ganghwense]
MKEKLKIIVLAAVITSNFSTIGFASPASKTAAANKVKKAKVEFKQSTKKEERIKKLEETIKMLEKKYEEGLISKETYDAKKSNFNKMLENLKNGKDKLSKVDNLKKKKGEVKQLTKEERIRQLEESIKMLEKKHKEGLISKEKYDAKKAYFNERLENIRELNEITADNIKSYKVGMNQVTINVNGQNRRFKFYVPENLSREGVSLVFRFHGSVSISQDPIDSVTKNYILNQIANDENIIVVYPAGTAGAEDTMITWNDTEKNLAFFDEMVKCFEKTFDNIDSNRIYTCGHSSGAIFSFTLAGFREDKIAAAVPVSGQYNLTKNPEKSTFIGNDISVPIRAYNGTEDRSVNYQAASDNMRVWAEKENRGNPIKIEEKLITIGDYDVKVEQWRGGMSDLEMYSIQDEEHGISWDTIAQSMWKFMKNHPKNK